MIRFMKKTFIRLKLCFCAVFLLPIATLFAQKTGVVKSNIYVRTGSTAAVKNDLRSNDWSFGGAYSLFRGSFTGENYEAVVQVKLKLKEADCVNELATVSSWEKAYVAFDLPAIPKLRIYGGHGFSLSQPGSFYSLPEEYAGGTRWGKDGIGFLWRHEFIQAGAAFSSGTSSYTIKDELQAGAGITFNFEKLNLPFESGFSLMIDKSKENEFSPSFFSRIRPNKNLTISAGCVFFAPAMTSNSSFKRVENYNLSALDECRMAILISRLKLNAVTIEEEAECALSEEDDYYSLYLACRLSVALGTIFTVRPAVMYYAAGNTKDSEKSRDAFVLYPRAQVSFKKGKHVFSFGFQIEHREYAHNSYGRIFKLPFYYKYTL